MTWRKLGRVYVARVSATGANPRLLPDRRRLGDRLRVFCAFLDSEKVGRVGWVDLDRVTRRACSRSARRRVSTSARRAPSTTTA